LTKLNIGRIAYTNTWPVSYFFDKSKFNDEIVLIPQVPSQLNKRMAEGTIAMGPISSFAYAAQAGEYVLMPDLSVSAYGTVGSISLFFKKDLEDAANHKVALTNTSETSVNLLKIIMEAFVGGKPEYITMSPNLDAMMEEADAALLIGDEALLANMTNQQTNRYQMIDLGEEWRRRTNHWMTFAVWAVRKEVLTDAPELLYRIYQEFMRSKQEGKEKRNQIIQSSIKQFGGTEAFWNQYFQGLSHDFGKEQVEGLNHYYQLAQKIGVLKEVPDIQIIDFNQLSIHSSVK